MMPNEMMAAAVNLPPPHMAVGTGATGEDLASPLFELASWKVFELFLKALKLGKANVA